MSIKTIPVPLWSRAESNLAHKFADFGAINYHISHQLTNGISLKGICPREHYINYFHELYDMNIVNARFFMRLAREVSGKIQKCNLKLHAKASLYEGLERTHD
jgi:hypothetical protein